MKAKFDVRLRLEAALALVTLSVAAITLTWPSWIEIVFGVDPDHGSGSFERLLVGGAAALCLVSLLLARGQWKRSRSEMAANSTSA